MVRLSEGHVGSGDRFEWNHVSLDLYLCLYYTVTVSLLHLFLKCKIKIAHVEFYIRCLFMFILSQYSISYPQS